MTSSVASGEQWENYLSSYLRPVASKRPFCQSVYQSNCQSGGIPQFEELRVLPKEAQEANSITSPYLEQNHMTKTMTGSGSKEEGASTTPRSLGKAVYAVDYTLPVVNSGTFLNDCNVVDPYVDPQGARVGIQHNANYMTLKFGKAFLKSTKYLGRGNELNNPQRVATAPSSTPADLFGSHNAQCEVTDQQELQELVENDSFVDGSNTEACLYQQFNTVTGEQELVDGVKEGNSAKMRTLPNFSTFRVFSKVTKLDMGSHDKINHPVQLENMKNALIADQQEQMGLIDCESMTSQKVRNMTVRGVSSNPEINMQGNTCLKDQRHCINEFDHFTGKDIIARGSTNQRRKTVSCNVCFKSFSQTANLKAHLRIHTGEKPFECPVCHNRFSQRSSVKTHMRIHSGERPFQCSICPKSFYDSSTLIKHRRIHTGEKPYFCKICKHEFSQSGNLTRHYKLHTK